MASSSQSSFTGKKLYEGMKRHILSERQLRQFGFPRPSDNGSVRPKFYTEKKNAFLRDNEKLCRRCGKRYRVTEAGTPVVQQECLYHCARKNKVTGTRGTFQWRYGCCNKLDGTEGCTVVETHVYEDSPHDDIDGYLKTLPAPDSDPRNYKIFSLDGEMIYTKAGLALARVTLVGDRGETVYESLMKPYSDIVDYNTRFSGISKKDLDGVEKTLRDVQTEMLKLISDKTILIGHSLDHDLVKLKLIHDTVVDTSYVFPHKKGLPYRRALRDLVADYFDKTIQADAGGHDSKEDAVACMELMIYKVKQEDNISSLLKAFESIRNL